MADYYKNENNSLPMQVQENKQNIEYLCENGFLPNFMGVYSDTTVYSFNDVITYKDPGEIPNPAPNGTYIHIGKTQTRGVSPKGTSTDPVWRMLIAEGEAGLQGQQGFGFYKTDYDISRTTNTIPKSRVIVPSGSTVNVGDFIIATSGTTVGNFALVTGMTSTDYSISYQNSLRGPTGQTGQTGPVGTMYTHHIYIYRNSSDPLFDIFFTVVSNVSTAYTADDVKQIINTYNDQGVYAGTIGSLGSSTKSIVIRISGDTNNFTIEFLLIPGATLENIALPWANINIRDTVLSY